MGSRLSMGAEFYAQWRNPTDTLSVLMIIGAEIVQTALAQMTGGRVAFVAFSFGWVAYSFKTLVSLVGDGRLMPTPDYPCKLINAKNGYIRDNKSWLLSRLLRDDVKTLTNEGLMISVYRAKDRSSDGSHLVHGQPRRGQLDFLSVVTIVAQLLLAAIPWMSHHEPDVFIITAWGTVLATLTGSLPQWRVEKYACRDLGRERTKKNVILTQGNGSRYAMLILSDNAGLDFEDLAAGEGPRVARPWEKIGIFVRRKQDVESGQTQDGQQKPSNAKLVAETMMWKNLPVDFWLTRLLCLVLAAFWIALLITVAGLVQNSWYLLLVGAIGMAQNAIVAGASREPEKKGFELEFVEDIRCRKVMDALMELELSYPGVGFHMLREFFPTGLKPSSDEQQWWKGDMEAFDNERNLPDNEWRQAVRSSQPDYEELKARRTGYSNVEVNAADRN